jgi:hypothetical protein
MSTSAGELKRTGHDNGAGICTTGGGRRRHRKSNWSGLAGWQQCSGAAGACVGALYATHLGSLIEVVNRFGSWFYGALLGVFVLAVADPRADGRGAVSGLLLGMGVVWVLGGQPIWSLSLGSTPWLSGNVRRWRHRQPHLLVWPAGEAVAGRNHVEIRFSETIPARRLVACPWVGIRHSRDWGLERGWCGNSRDFPSGQFFLRNSNTPGFADVPVVVIAGTQPGDLPLAGDWDSDGRDTPGVFRATAQSAQFFLSSANASGPLPVPINYGLVSDRPVVGKWR